MTSIGIERRRAGGGSCEGSEGGASSARAGSAVRPRHSAMISCCASICSAGDSLGCLPRRWTCALSRSSASRASSCLRRAERTAVSSSTSRGRAACRLRRRERGGRAALEQIVDRGEHASVRGERAVILVDEERADALEEAERVRDLAVAVAGRPEGELPRAVDLYGGDGRAVVAGDVHEPLRVDHRLQLVVELLGPVEVLLLRLERAPGGRLVQPSRGRRRGSRAARAASGTSPRRCRRRRAGRPCRSRSRTGRAS